jgi:hypothetical protein
MKNKFKTILFLPNTLEDMQSDLASEATSYKPDELLIKYLAELNYDPDTKLPNNIRAQLNLLDWTQQLSHYFSGPKIDMHPEFASYPIHWEFIPNNCTLPAEVAKQLKMPSPHNPKSTNDSYTLAGRSTTLLIWVQSGATIEQCLAQLTEMERISDWVSRDYESELNEGEDSIWEIMDLHGDDDVDYNSGYLDSCIQFLRAHLYTATKDPRFLQ